MKTFFILETTTNTKQPLRWKFTQIHKQLSALSPDFNCLWNMCLIAYKNIRKFDAKKCNFFCPKCLNGVTPPPPTLYKGGR